MSNRSGLALEIAEPSRSCCLLNVKEICQQCLILIGGDIIFNMEHQEPSASMKSRDTKFPPLGSKALNNSWAIREWAPIGGDCAKTGFSYVPDIETVVGPLMTVREARELEPTRTGSHSLLSRVRGRAQSSPSSARSRSSVALSWCSILT